jgi:predicted patatin/cPLA2 family phospholipase
MTIRKQLLAALVAPLLIAGCTTTQRLTAVPAASALQADTGFGPVRFLVGRETDSFAAEAHASLVKERAWQEANGSAGPLPAANFLAISGGGDNGAFGAGFLTGWSATGKRPEFKVVTGVSTGALTAPFAFLGSGYDANLTRVFTTISQANIFKSRGMVKGVLGDAMADSRPLANLIAANVDQPLLDAIAAEYAKGRVLLVGTTNLDALEPVIWNMTAIAASRQPGALQLFRSVLLASASIPGAFPPVMINVNVGGVPHQEMHVDGGTMAQVFVYPPSLTEARIGETTHRERHLYVIRNARFDSEWKDVPRKTMPIAARAIGSLTTTQGIGDLYRIYATSQRDGVDFNFVNIPSTFAKRHREEFDTEYMRDLYALGKQMAEAGQPWHKVPPGFERAGRE